MRKRQALFLSKSQIGLFILLQTSVITYRQLFLSHLHGHTEAAGRLSLKRLEKRGYIQSKILPQQSKTKYYYLAPKGRDFCYLCYAL